MTDPPGGSPGAPDDLDQVLRETRLRFIAECPDKCASMETLVAGAFGPEGQARIASLKSLAHKLAGLGGTLGFPVASAEAARLEALAGRDEGGPFDMEAAARAVASIREAFYAELTQAPAWSAPEPVPEASGRAVLVVEDEPGQRAIMASALRRAGYTAVDVTSGDLVLAAAREAQPAAIVLDIALPGLDGFTVCRQLKADPDLSSIPVIFVTTGPNLDDKLTGLSLGADEFLSKPVDMRELILRIGLAVKRARSPLPAPRLVPAEARSVGPASRLILLAEDDPEVARIVDAQMRGEGYRTLMAFDGEQALALLAHAPDVLVLDLMLPRLTGFEVLASLKQGPKPFRILVLSARAREDDVTRAFEMGADDYMAKPFSPQELKARVARLLR